MNKINPKEIKKVQESGKNFIFSVIGFKTVDYKGEYNTVELPEPVKNRSGNVSLFNPVTLLIFKRRLISRLNSEIENKIKGIIQFKVKVVGTGEEKWI